MTAPLPSLSLGWKAEVDAWFLFPRSRQGCDDALLRPAPSGESCRDRLMGMAGTNLEEASHPCAAHSAPQPRRRRPLPGLHRPTPLDLPSGKNRTPTLAGNERSSHREPIQNPIAKTTATSIKRARRNLTPRPSVEPAGRGKLPG